MEWYDNDRALQEEVKADRSRVLTNTSGNAQLYPTGSSYYTGDQKSLPPEKFRLISNHQFPTPKSTLYSNDHQAYVRQRQCAKRLKKRIRLAQAYLNHPKFTDFLNRPRKDVKGGEVIWDDETERAFHHAIINIPGIGKKKKSQHGKTLGRNELVAEWIRQETGRKRTRKQVSSHIQTLDNIFKPKPEDGFAGIPEWKLMTKPPLTGDDAIDGDGLDFYDNSIADMVQNWKLMQVDLSQNDIDFQPTEPSHTEHPVIGYSDAISLMTLDFEMWVSLPERMAMAKALHKYTCVQSSQAIGPPENLDNIPDWRTSWPDLAAIIDNRRQDEAFDIILLQTSFELMLDFPPRGSKLGIGLVLEFEPPMSNSEKIASWNCKTHIYQRQQLELKALHTDCITPKPGTVKPPFESKWWAAQFTQLTEKRRFAMDSGGDAEVAAADESARNYLKNLRIMQEVSAEVDLSTGSASMHGKGTRERRAAILLWSFSQAGSRFVGTTTWRKLVAPDIKVIHGLLLPAYDAALPSLPTETPLEEYYDGDAFESRHGFIPHILPSNANSFMTGTDEDLHHGGFLMPNHHDHLRSAPHAYDSPSRFQHADPHHHNHDFYQLNIQHVDGHDLQSGISLDEHIQPNFSTNLFHGQRHFQHSQTQPFVPPQEAYGQPTNIAYEFDHYDRRQVLSSFDMNTHRLLQSQLQDLNNSSSAEHTHPQSAPPPHHEVQHPPVTQSPITADPDEEVLRNALIIEVSRPATNTTEFDQVRSLDNNEHHVQPSHGEHNILTLHAPTAIRPPLQQHHSFAGVLQIQPSPAQTMRTIHRTSPRRRFSLLLEGLCARHEEHGNLYEWGHLDNTHTAQIHDHSHDYDPDLSTNTIRSHSVPPSTQTVQSTRQPFHSDINTTISNGPEHESAARPDIGHDSNQQAIRESVQPAENDGWIEIKNEGEGDIGMQDLCV